jgi:hypothetical protein
MQSPMIEEIVEFTSIVEQVKYTDSLLKFVTLIDTMYDDDELFKQEDATIQQKELVAKLVQALCHFTLLGGVHLNNIENQTFASEHYSNLTEFMSERVIPLQQKLMNHYTHFHKKWIAPAVNDQQEEIDGMLIMANYQIVLYSQCAFSLMKNKTIPKTEQTMKIANNLKKFKMDYIIHAGKLYNEILKMIQNSDGTLKVNNSVFDSNTTYSFMSVKEGKTTGEYQVKPVVVDVKGTKIKSFQYHYNLENQVARVLTMRALFLREMYGTILATSSSTFTEAIRQNFDQALAFSHRDDSLILFEVGRYQSASKEYHDAFVTFFRSALVAKQGDLMKTKAVYLSAINYSKWTKRNREESEVLKDLLSEWTVAHPEVKERESSYTAVIDFLKDAAALAEQQAETVLAKSDKLAQHFTTTNRRTQLEKLKAEVAQLVSK